MKPSTFLSALVILLVGCATPKPSSWTPGYSITRFESSIKNFEKQDSASMPAPNGIVLTGSSSFALWKDPVTDLAPLPIINRGFGGSTLTEVIHYLDRSVLKYNPSKIVIYCENDMFTDETPKTPELTRDEYVRLVKDIRKKNKTARIYYVSMKPSPSRWNAWDKIVKANELIKKEVDADPTQTYIDITQIMLKDGRPDGSIFLSDSLHMLQNGYDRWVQVLKPALSN